jgi:hypothetical protein
MSDYSDYDDYYEDYYQDYEQSQDKKERALLVRGMETLLEKMEKRDREKLPSMKRANPFHRGQQVRGRKRGRGRSTHNFTENYEQTPPPRTYFERRGRRQTRGTSRGRTRERGNYSHLVRQQYRGPSASQGRNPESENPMEYRPVRGDPIDYSSYHCPGCRCREMEEEKRKQESDRKREKEEKMEEESLEKDKSKDKKKHKDQEEEEDDRRVIVAIGHSFLTHLGSHIGRIKKEDRMSWEEVMCIDQEKIKASVFGISGAKLDKWPALEQHVKNNRATRVIIELGTNDLCGPENALDLADQLILKAIKMMDEGKEVKRCLICLVIPRTKDPEHSKHKLGDFLSRMKDFNSRIKKQCDKQDDLEYWIHGGLENPSGKMMDRKGVHPIKKGMDLYKESISRALIYMNS